MDRLEKLSDLRSPTGSAEVPVGSATELLLGLIHSLTSVLDAKDTYTCGHSARVAGIAVELGRELALGEQELSDLYLAGLLHDIGRIGLSDRILGKAGALTVEEFEHVRQHVTIGYGLLSALRPVRAVLPGVLYHHERHDGKGYPDGLSGRAIPLQARILAVADAYDAMTTPRPHRDALPHRQVEEVLREGAGSQWDPQVVDAFLRCRHRVHTLRQSEPGDPIHRNAAAALRI